MIGFVYDFDNNDVLMNRKGDIQTGDINRQNCALIAMSETCRLTAPDVGERLGSKLVNRPRNRVRAAVADAERAVRRDGGTDVSIVFTGTDNLVFNATYK